MTSVYYIVWLADVAHDATSKLHQTVSDFGILSLDITKHTFYFFKPYSYAFWKLFFNFMNLSNRFVKRIHMAFFKTLPVTLWISILDLLIYS